MGNNTYYLLTIRVQNFCDRSLIIFIPFSNDSFSAFSSSDLFSSSSCSVPSCCWPSVSVCSPADHGRKKYNKVKDFYQHFVQIRSYENIQYDMDLNAKQNRRYPFCERRHQEKKRNNKTVNDIKHKSEWLGVLNAM